MFLFVFAKEGETNANKLIHSMTNIANNLISITVPSRLKKIKVIITISLDGTGKIFEYARYPLNWENFNNVLQQYINLQKNIIADHYNKEISGTCHRGLYQTFENIISHEDPDCCNCPDECLYKNKPKLIIIDETSMIDTNMFYDILKMCY